MDAFPSYAGVLGGAGSFSQGTQQTVTATANTGFIFAGWMENGVLVSTSANYSFTLIADRNLTASFTNSIFTMYSMVVKSSSVQRGLVFGAKTVYAKQVCNVRAVPKPGYKFLYWKENGKVLSTKTSFSVRMNANHKLIGYFGKK